MTQPETKARFPITRLRRLRRTEALRGMVRETQLSPHDFVYPLFVTHGQGIKQEIASMPGQYHLSIDQLAAEAQEVHRLGIPAVILFGLPATKDEAGSEAYDDAGIVQEAIKTIKEAAPELMVITDVCLCEYTSHGHCGIVLYDGSVDNDRSLELIARTALSHARAGADMVAPSDMMDGRVAAIRDTLDKEGYANTPIMAYSAKYSSAFYGPFREAAGSTPQFGDRRGYQMDPPNAREAMREIEQDILEGADIVMVKPALAYLDIIARARERFDHPIAAYNVSGEYAMVKAAGRMGWIDEERIAMEILTGIKRAGADIIITYHAKDVAKRLRGEFDKESYEKEREKNFTYYDAHSQEIRDKHQGHYVAIADGKLIKVCKSYDESRDSVKGYRHALVFGADSEPMREPVYIRGSVWRFK
ncbi:MAG: porphobilinogen synthase [Dehalococcoidia bacterium]|nr:porphobilinogen synthase [Dehalococcoidia bacterium]